jgi:hypothetical protein
MTLIALNAFVRVVGGLAVLMTGVGFWNSFAHSRADRNAAAFCRAILPGANIESLRGGTDPDPSIRRVDIGDELLFVFQGGVFQSGGIYDDDGVMSHHAGVCRVTTAGGKVVRTKLEIYDEDD